MRLHVATDAQIERIYRESHRLWGGGLSYDAYLDLWWTLRDTPWARDRVEFLVGSDEHGRVLSSLKRYRPIVRLDGRDVTATVIGALLTPRELRRRGHAAELVRKVLERAARQGDAAALLFSDVGVAYYRALGFRALPAEECRGVLPRGGPAPRCALRVMEPGDFTAVERAHDAVSRDASLAMVRDRPQWDFLRLRSHAFFERLDDRSIAHHCSVAVRDGEIAGYVVSVEAGGEWNVREAGAVDGDPRTVADILSAAGAEASRRGCRRVYAWLSREVGGHLDRWRLRWSARDHAIPMFRPLDARTDPDGWDEPGAIYLPFLDQF